MPETDGNRKNAHADDHEILCEAVREGGALALGYFKSDPKHWDKGKDDPVSEADIAVNHLLSGKLTRARPSYGWLSEETEDDPRRLSCSRVWVIDPIDGTRAFLKGKPHFTICGALVENGRPVAAAIFNPATDEFFDALAGGGARLNGAAIHVTPRHDIEGCRMAAFGPMFRHPAWPEPWPAMEIVDRNSVAYRLALVAGGMADAALALNKKNDWDIAGADLLVHEAGGLLTSHKGETILYNTPAARHPSLVAAGPALHDALLVRVRGLDLP